MKFKPQPAPHISHPETTRTLMLNTIIALLVLYGMSFFYYGTRALLLGLCGLLTALTAETISTLLLRRKINPRDLSAFVTGLLVPLMMPASIPFYVPIVATLFAIFVVKFPFGGTGHNFFNPAAGGVAFAIVAFPAIMFQYPVPRAALPIFPTAELVTVSSPMLNVGLGGIPSYSLEAILWGNVPGPMGATNALVLVACLFFLLSRRTVQWETPVFFLLATMAIGFYIPILGTTRLESMLYEITNGLLLFGAVFLLGDPVTRPKRDWANILYAIITGIMVMIFRRAGRIQEEFVFALLVMNVFVWPIELLVERIAHKVRRKRFEAIRR